MKPESDLPINSDILIVDDQEANLAFLTGLLQRTGYKVRQASNGELALLSAKAKLPALILLDVKMPEMDGYEVCRKLKKEETTRGIPIIFISALEDELSKISGFKAGAVDYITKPFKKEEVLARIKTHFGMRQMQLKLESQNKRLLDGITERKQAEVELKKSEEKFRNLFENSPLGKSMTGIDGSLHVNKAFSEIVGYSEDELKTLKWMDITHPDDIQPTNEMVQSLIEGKTTQTHFEKRYIQKNGIIVHTEGSTYLQRDKEGKPLYFITSINDVTERKKIEETLINSEKEFRQLSESMPQIVWITRPDGWNIYFNQQWVDYTGLTLEESYGEGWNKPFHPDDQQRAWDTWQNAVTNNGIYSLECRLRRFDGSYRWWLIRGVPILDESGTILKWFGTCTDIEEIKQSDIELKETKAMLQAAFDNSQAGIAIAEAPTGRLLYVNQAALVIREKSKEEIVDDVDIEKYASLWNIYHLDGTPFQPEEVPLARAVLFGETISEEFIVRRDNLEDRFVWANAAPIRDENGNVKFGIVVFSDITERKQTEQELIKNEAFIRTAVDNLPLIFYSIDQDGIFQLSIGAGLKGLGLEPNQVVGMSAYDIYKDHPGIVASVRKSLDGEPSYFESTVNGISHDNYLVPITDMKGSIAGVVGAAMDITERKSAEEALRVNEKLLTLFIKHSPIYVYIKEVTPTTSRVITASDNFIDMIGISGPDMKGKLMDELFPPEFAAQITADDWEVVSKGEILKLDEILNDRHFNTIKFPILAGGKNMLAGYTIDITDRTLAEEKIRKFNEELEQLVEKRTVELNETIAELEEQTRIFVGRELRMIELKEQIAELEMKLEGKRNNPNP